MFRKIKLVIWYLITFKFIKILKYRQNEKSFKKYEKFIESKYLKKNNCEISTKKNLIVTNLQEAIGDQVICLDLMSRISKSKDKENFDFLVHKSFLPTISELNKKWKLNILTYDRSLGTHLDLKKGKFNKKNIKILTESFSHYEYDQIFVPSRTIPIDLLLIFSSMKFNKVHKFKDNFKLPEGNGVFAEWSFFKNIARKVSTILENKIVIQEINDKKHFIFNCIDVFNRIWPNCKLVHKEKITPYEYVDLDNVIEKQQIVTNEMTIFYLINRIEDKILNFDILLKSFKKIESTNESVKFIFATKLNQKKFNRLKKTINSNLKNFELHNNLPLDKLMKKMNEANLVVCNDSFDFHMSNLLDKKTLLVVNKSQWIIIFSFDYWLNYNSTNNQTLRIEKANFGDYTKRDFEENKNLTEQILKCIENF